MTMPELMMNVRTCVTATTTYTIVCQITMSYLMMIVHTCATVSTTYSMLY